MKPEERSMILDLFDRIATAPQDNIDREADQVIRDAVARNPNAPYVLVQTALLQEEALRRADERIRQLQEAASPANADRDTSFLGSGRRLGGGSVPNAGSRQSAAPDSYRGPDDSRYAQPMPAPPVPPQSMQPSGGGGGFLSSALTTAGGVAGGMLLADGIRGLFSGSHGSDLWGRTADAQTSTSDSSKDTSTSASDLAAQDRAQDAQQDADDDQDALQDADDDQDDQDDGGWDDSDSIDA